MKRVVYMLAPMLLLLSGTSMAADVGIVAKVRNVQGNVVLERGNAHFTLKNNMSLINGDKVIVLDKGALNLVYSKSSCQISHPQNTLLTVADAAQCAKGVNFGMGAPSMGAGAGTSSGAGAGTGAAAGGGAGAAGAGSAAAGAGAAGAGAGAAAAGAAGAATVGGIAAAAGGLSLATVAAAAAAVAGVAAAAGAGGGDNTPVSP